jgi:heterodisulfide reductase subunit A
MSEEKEEEARIGIFVCHCGSNIGGLIDCKTLAESTKTLSGVVHSEDNLYTCSETGLTSIKNAIKEHDLNRVIVAACTPRTHEPLFRECISEEGLNPYLFNFVNIRDQCTWVHMKHPEEAYIKAQDLIKMGAAKALQLEPLEKTTVDITPTAVVIGGGVTGMSAAISLSKQGFKTHLVEKEDKLGGRLNSLNMLFPHAQEASVLLEDLNKKVEESKNLEVLTNSKIKSIDGFIGNFDVEIEQDGSSKEIKVGAILVTVGASIVIVTGLCMYDGETRITQLELEPKLKNDEVKAKNVVMIQCVDCRTDDRPYCSAVCCMTALKNALVLKKKNPDTNVVILFRDLYTPGTDYEEHYRRAREAGIIFIKYNLEKLPEVEENQVKVFNEYIDDEMIIPYDLLVLSTPLIANDDNKVLAQMLKVPLEANGFFLEAHVKLRPNDFATDGVFVGGAAKWPVDITESITQGYAAASRAGTILSHKTIEVEGAVAVIDPEACIACGECRPVCEYNAIEAVETGIEFKAIRDSFNPSVKFTRFKSRVLPALCKGCGTCFGACPVGAITPKHFTKPQLLAMIETYLC